MNDLIERYIYAATRQLNRKQRDDVARELRGLIEDLLTERCGLITPTEKDIRVVLTELGTPQELYEKYDEDAKKCLIGPPYYSTYKFVLKIVLGSVLAGSMMISALLMLLEPPQILTALPLWMIGAARWLVLLYHLSLSAFAVVTLLFAWFYHKGIRITEPFNFDDLPPVPKRSQEIPVWESVGGIVMCVLFMVLFLGFPQLLGVYREGGTYISLFNISAIRAGWYYIVAFGLCGIFREVIRLMERRYNRRVLTVTLVTDILSAGIAAAWLSGADVFDPGFRNSMETLFARESAFLATFMGNFQWFFLGILLFALTLDAAEAVYKTLKE